MWMEEGEEVCMGGKEAAKPEKEVRLLLSALCDEVEFRGRLAVFPYFRCSYIQLRRSWAQRSQTPSGRLSSTGRHRA
jgi:hypothetical protein